MCRNRRICRHLPKSILEKVPLTDLRAFAFSLCATWLVSAGSLIQRLFPEQGKRSQVSRSELFSKPRCPQKKRPHSSTKKPVCLYSLRVRGDRDAVGCIFGWVFGCELRVFVCVVPPPGGKPTPVGH